MRPLRILFCIVLLTPFAFGQSGTTPPSSQPGSSTQNSTQQPQNPINDQLQTPTQDTGKPKQQTSSFDLGDTSSGQDTSLGEVRLMIRNTEINGDRTRSFLSPGLNRLGEFNYYADHSFIGTRRIQFLAMYRGTNDRSIDPEQNSFQKGYLRIFGPRDEYVFGDVLVNFSRMSFNQNIKGVSAAWKLGKRWKLSTVGGVYTDRWGSLYKPFSETPNRPYTSGVAGARLEVNPTRGTSLGFNFSSAEDMLGSLPATPAGTPPLPSSNRLGSVDGRLQYKQLRINGEFAESATIFDMRTNEGFVNDWSTDVEGSWRHNRLAMRAAYVRFQPNFSSFNARQTVDLQDWLIRPSYDLTDWLTIDGTIRRSNNNLAGQLPYGMITWGPEGRFIFHNLSFYRRGTFEIGYRHRLTTATDNSIHHYVRDPYAEFTMPYKSTFFTIGYEQRRAIDDRNPAQSSNTNRVYVSLRGIYDIGGWNFNPQLRWELERQGSRPQLPVLYPLEYDSNRLATVSLYAEAPKWFIIELDFRDASATILGPAGYSRPSYAAAVTYKIANDENKKLIFSFTRNSNFYFPPSPSFDERVYGVTFVYRFGHRGR